MYEHDKCMAFSEKKGKYMEGNIIDFGSETIAAAMDAAEAFGTGRKVLLYIYSPVMGVCLYKGTVKAATASALLIEKASLIKTEQKRDDTRVDINLRYKITSAFTGHGIEKKALDEPVDIVILNLSAKGMYIATEAAWHIGHRFPLTFREAGQPISLDAEVVRQRTGINKINYYGCRFNDICQMDTDNIYRYVLHQQIEQRRRSIVRY